MGAVLNITLFRTTLETVFLRAALWKQREYLNTHPYFRRELWIVLKLPRILYFYTNTLFKIPNIPVKGSRSLFLFYYITLKMFEFLKNFLRKCLYAFAAVKVTKTSQETRNFSEQAFLLAFQALDIPPEL